MIILLAVFGFLITLLLTPIIIYFSPRLKLINNPNPVVETHKIATPLGGGIAVFIAILSSLIFIGMPAELYERILWGIVPVFILGLIDDIFYLRAGLKFILQIAAVIPYVLLLSPQAQFVPLIIFSLVYLINAWNLIDIMDGLLGWTAGLCFTGITLILYLLSPNIQNIFILSLISSAAIFGFLPWNSYPAKIFMGDSGSLAIGMMFGIIVSESALSQPKIVVPLIICGAIPIFEITFLIIERSIRRIPFYKASPDHFALRLVHSGKSVPIIIRRVRYAAVALCVYALGLAFLRDNLIFVSLLLAIFAKVVTVALKYFHSLPVNR